MAPKQGHVSARSYQQRILDHKLRRLKVDIAVAGLKQVQIAKDLGIDVSRLSKLINGWIPPKHGEWEAIRDYVAAAKSAAGASCLRRANSGVSAQATKDAR
jgi:hypothetical protein